MTRARAVYEPATLGFAILGLLSHESMSGYQIRRRFEDTPIGSYSSSPGSIYPALERLKAEGLVAQRSAGGRKRFALTDAGLAQLKGWLSRPVTRDDMERRDETLLLRFAFMTDLVPRSTVTAFLKAFRKEAGAHAMRLARYRGEEGAALPLCGGLAVDRGMETFRAHERWADTALTALQSAPARARSGRAKRGRR